MARKCASKCEIGQLNLPTPDNITKRMKVYATARRGGETTTLAFAQEKSTEVIFPSFPCPPSAGGISPVAQISFPFLFLLPQLFISPSLPLSLSFVLLIPR
jgi:hypothetical protein